MIMHDWIAQGHHAKACMTEPLRWMHVRFRTFDQHRTRYRCQHLFTWFWSNTIWSFETHLSFSVLDELLLYSACLSPMQFKGALGAVLKRATEPMNFARQGLRISSTILQGIAQASLYR